MGTGLVGGEACPDCGGKGCVAWSLKVKVKVAPKVLPKAKKDDTYLRKQILRSVKRIMKRASRKDLMKGPQMKNPHFESTNQEEHAYVGTEERRRKRSPKRGHW